MRDKQTARFVPVDLATFQRAVWAANREGAIGAELRESLLRVSLDSDRGTGTNVRITEDAAADLRVAPRTLRERLRAARGTWLLQTAKSNRPGRDGVPRLARFRLQSPEPLAAAGRDDCQRSTSADSEPLADGGRDSRQQSSEPLARSAKTVGSEHAGGLPSTSPHVRHERGDDNRKGDEVKRQQQLDDETVRRIPQVADRYELDEPTARQLVELAAADPDTTYPVGRLLQSPGYARHRLDQLEGQRDEQTARERKQAAEQWLHEQGLPRPTDDDVSALHVWDQTRRVVACHGKDSVDARIWVDDLRQHLNR